MYYKNIMKIIQMNIIILNSSDLENIKEDIVKLYN